MIYSPVPDILYYTFIPDQIDLDFLVYLVVSVNDSLICVLIALDLLLSSHQAIHAIVFTRQTHDWFGLLKELPQPPDRLGLRLHF